MNVLDLIIIGAIGLLAIVGLKGGLIKYASGVGAVALGVVMGLNYQSEIAALLATRLSGDTLPRLVGFVVAAVLAFALFKGGAYALTLALPKFKLGMADHVAGALGGLIVGVLLLGTMMYMLSGINVTPTQEVMRSSLLAPTVTRASLLTPSIPWCSALDSGGYGQGDNCHSYIRLIGDLVGVDIKAKLQEMLTDDQDVDTMFAIVKTILGGGSPEQFVQIANTAQ